jgi:hypothetical protein
LKNFEGLPQPLKGRLDKKQTTLLDDADVKLNEKITSIVSSFNIHCNLTKKVEN